MMASTEETTLLVRQAVGGDRAAIQALFDRYRSQLTRMVAIRLDPRLNGRLDPSDIVQDVLVEATKRMSTDLSDSPVEFYPWLRGIAWDRLCRLHRHHVSTQKRSVVREQRLQPDQVDDESMLKLAECIAASGSGPGTQVMREERRRRVREAVTQLPAKDREIIVLRFLEELSIQDAAAVLDISLTAAKSRQLRAIARLQDMLGDPPSES